MKKIEYNFNKNIFNYEEIIKLIQGSSFKIGDTVLIKIRTTNGDYPFVHKKGIIIGYSYNPSKNTIEYSVETLELEKEFFYNIESIDIK